MKFILFVEGHTEDKALPAFLKRWLDPKLDFPVGIQTVRFDGWPDLWQSAAKKAKMYLKGSSKDKIIAVISLLDLYGPTIYPVHLTGIDERVAWGKRELENQVKEEKFFHCFAVHEVEAWLLSQPDLFPLGVRNAFPGKIVDPETVNFDEPPAKLLDRLYRQHTKHPYKKVINGRDLFSRLDPDRACEKCPQLQDLLDTMLRLARERGPVPRRQGE
ncbi:hypothetical protein Apau_1827 [Aminomonas paucivorans DSM 12260]|uniref:DUF4276 family protein n=1 Tax=Aminomonas paucivorans DSM 12260 TaxID=584708 RepID=E3CVY8_9BACT|nr:DUF4276 family protein [Aminomonas paucivorans]EFQ24243.1 hypothetical protein Apau_1827 [Aminomonas paucivorans DSM 12260]